MDKLMCVGGHLVLQFSPFPHEAHRLATSVRLIPETIRYTVVYHVALCEQLSVGGFDKPISDNGPVVCHKTS